MTDQNAGNTGSSYEPAEKIEKGLQGFLIFVQTFLITLRDITINKARLSESIKNPDDAKYTKPITFITIMSFLGIRAFRFGLLLLLVAFSNASCRQETYTDIEVPSLIDQLKVPTVSEVILYGIPILLVVVLAAQILKYPLLRNPSRSTESIVAIAYYSVGYQFIAFPLLFTLFTFLFLLSGLLANFEWLTYLVPIVSLAWGIIIFYRLVTYSIASNELRVSYVGFRQLWLSFCSLLLIAITTLSASAIIYYLAQSDFQDIQSRPVMSVGLVDFDSSEESTFTIDILFENNSDKEIIILSSQVKVFGRAVQKLGSQDSTRVNIN